MGSEQMTEQAPDLFSSEMTCFHQHSASMHFIWLAVLLACSPVVQGSAQDGEQVDLTALRTTSGDSRSWRQQIGLVTNNVLESNAFADARSPASRLLLDAQDWIRPDDLSAGLLAQSVALAVGYMLRQNQDGRFVYRDTVVDMGASFELPGYDSYNWLRHAGAVYSLCQAVEVYTHAHKSIIRQWHT